MAATVAACLAAVGVAGQLTALKVSDLVPSTEWLASMRGCGRSHCSQKLQCHRSHQLSACSLRCKSYSFAVAISSWLPACGFPPRSPDYRFRVQTRRLCHHRCARAVRLEALHFHQRRVRMHLLYSVHRRVRMHLLYSVHAQQQPSPVLLPLSDRLCSPVPLCCRWASCQPCSACAWKGAPSQLGAWTGCPPSAAASHT